MFTAKKPQFDQLSVANVEKEIDELRAVAAEMRRTGCAVLRQLDRMHKEAVIAFDADCPFHRDLEAMRVSLAKLGGMAL